MEDKKRKTNWSKEEIEVLSEEASSRINVIQGKFSNFLTHSDKKLCWQEITSK
ncbi:hypothetical protein FSP39_016560 [Pinctada imbricata]|nr:hypothetical protein FSP39_014967 [Pinctada imbricata]KAK3093505.1 hypothetical protein FSP39_016560 [Pinctada imbricata]